MATPNLINVDTITPSVVIGAVTTSRASIVDVTNAADITVEVSTDNGSSYTKIASTISVPADSSLSLIGKDNGFYLDETDILAVTASANSDLTYLVSYELMKDA